MKVGVPASIALHSALLAWAMLSLGTEKPEVVPVIDALPVELVPLAEASHLRLGDKTAKPKDEITKETKQSPKPSEGTRAGTDAKEEPPPPPPEHKPQQVAAVQPKEEPTPPRPEVKPPEPKPPEPKPIVKVEPKPEPPKPEPPKVEPKPDKPKEAEKAKDTGEGEPPKPKEPPKDVKALDKVIEEAKKDPPTKEPEKKPEPPKPEPRKVDAKADPKADTKADPKPAQPTRTAAVQPAATTQPASAGPAQPQKSNFNARAISDILNRNPTGSSAGAETRTASLGAATGRNSAVKMTQSETDALIGQIKRCWNPPIGSKEANLVVTLRFSLGQDGSLSGQPEVVQGPAHPLGISLARSAQRALVQCAPYRLPTEKYSAWQLVEATFNPNDL